ncbi:MAG: hypothetical protein ACRCTP_03720 [Aeromonas popoffii]|uniref:hypothetical protein n=1 Tax=Aeromonas popoffii TaxID=70856 RepID=UPI003F37E133
MINVKFSKEVVVSRTFEMSAREFVSHHLREIRQFGDELDLLVQSGVDPNFITSALTLYKEDINGFVLVHSDFDVYSTSEEDIINHRIASETVIQILELKFSSLEN